MKIRVLMIGPGESLVGGIASLVENLLPALDQKVDLLYFSTVKRRPLKASGRISLQNIALALFQYVRFLPALYSFRPHIIHLHTSQSVAWLKDTFYILVGKVHCCKVVLHVHAADFDELYGKRAGFIQYFSRKVMGFADLIIAVSEEWKERLSEIIPVDRIFTFKNCIAVDYFSQGSSDISDNRVKALFLGSVGLRKGAFDLLEAMGCLKSRECSIQIWIAGGEEMDGDMLRARARIEELQLGEMVKLIGTVLGSKKTELLKNASLFVLPSYNEGLPIAVLEAMASGLPVVSTPVGGIPEVVKNGYNGFLITPGDVEALAEKLNILASDLHLCEVMGRRNRRIAEQELDVKPYVEKLIALYESLASL